MTRIGIVGTGKLGLPVALAINSQGYEVHATDLNKDIEKYLTKEVPYPHKEEGIEKLLETNTIKWHNYLDDVLENSDIVFVPVQTPHELKYEGITRLSYKREDFDYTYLKKVIENINYVLYSKLKQKKTVNIISTVLPGTLKREIFPRVSEYCQIIYNPFFIAMGTVINDFMNPEFVLLGGDKDKVMEEFYNDFYWMKLDKGVPICSMSIESAELCKVLYNTFISTKIVFANTIGEICDRTPGANCDDIVNALCKGKDRIISPKYLIPGLGDGGGCHPRDNIALSWLAKDLDLSCNIFDWIMKAREHQTEYLAEVIERELKWMNMKKICILGYSFKPETNITTGSPALLLEAVLKERFIDVVKYDPHIDNPFNFSFGTFSSPLYFIGCKHDCFKEYKFPKNSVVIDPFRYIPKQDGVKVVRIGE